MTECERDSEKLCINAVWFYDAAAAHKMATHFIEAINRILSYSHKIQDMINDVRVSYSQYLIIIIIIIRSEKKNSIKSLDRKLNIFNLVFKCAFFSVGDVKNRDKTFDKSKTDSDALVQSLMVFI